MFCPFLFPMNERQLVWGFRLPLIAVGFSLLLMRLSFAHNLSMMRPPPAHQAHRTSASLCTRCLVPPPLWEPPLFSNRGRALWPACLSVPLHVALEEATASFLRRFQRLLKLPSSVAFPLAPQTDGQWLHSFFFLIFCLRAASVSPFDFLPVTFPGFIPAGSLLWSQR